MTLGELKVEKTIQNKAKNIIEEIIIIPQNNAVPGDNINGNKMYEKQVR